MKKTISIILVCALALALAVSVTASSGTINKEVTYRDVKITLNGEALTPKDANGNPTEPFIMDGSTYLPVRAVANALGLSVDWDAATSTVKLSDAPNNSDQVNAGTSQASNHIIDVDISNCHIKYLKHEIVENMAGEKCLAVFYEFTNNSDESKSFVYTVSDKAFQNGVEIKSSLFHVNEESKNSGSEIKPGVTITVCSGFVLADDSDVEIDIGEWITLKKTPDDSMVISLK